MNTFLTALLDNPRTSILGMVAGAWLYLTGSGLAFPTTKAEWTNLGGALILAALGVSAKDGHK